MNIIGRFLVIDDNDDASRVTELVFMGIHPNHLPSNAIIGTQESVALVVREQMVTDRSYTHHETRSRRREYATKIVRGRNRVKMK